MTDPGYTHISMLIDRSGSMLQIAEDTAGGVNALIKEQAAETKDNQRCTVTLAQFDDKYDVVHDFRNIHSIEQPAYQLLPRGVTALFDSLGRLITSTGAQLARMPEERRPGTVLFVIATDGHENASRTYNRDQIKDMITLQQDLYGWKFVYLGANQDSFKVADGIGIARASTMDYATSSLGTAAAYTSTSALISGVRVGGQAEFTQGQRTASVQKDPVQTGKGTV